MVDEQFSFNIVSINARGLNDRKKRRNLFRWLKKNKFDICFVQETYSTKTVENIWKNEWGGRIIFSHGSSHSRGVMILIRPGFDANASGVHVDNIGRLIWLDMLIQDTKFNLINIYAPNHEDNQVNFYCHLRRLVKTKTLSGDHILLGGDFNFVSDPLLDRKGGVPISRTNKREVIQNYLMDIKEHGQLKDIWRVKNPQTKRFTWRRVNPRIKSRLDYWLTSEKTEDFIKETDIMPVSHTDHSAIALKLESINGRGKGRGQWRLNTTFLKEELYVKTMIENKEKWNEEFKNITDPSLKWELIKYRIRQFSMKYGKEKARDMKNTEKELEEKLKQLEYDQDNIDEDMEVELEEKICELKAKLEEIAEYKTQGLILRSQANWHEKGEKSTKYFLQLESRNRIKKSVRKLQRADGTFTTCEKEILDMQAKFYEQLYSARCQKTTEEKTEYINNVTTPRLSNEERERCEGLLTMEECSATLKTFKPNKSPGNDGLPAEFYQKFWPLFGRAALNSFNYAYQHGKLSTSQRQATITLLDKGKDRNQLKNWRPISLLNADYKIISKALANRFTKLLPNIINNNQTGFVKGRHISDNIRTVSDILHYLKDNDQPGILINIDFEKAFDSLDWEFMLLTLKKFNFGPSFIKWVKTLYTNISSCIINNGHTSNFFNVGRGVRQGDPMSPYLFILVVEIMASMIRKNKDIEGIRLQEIETKVLQYADDTSGILRNLSSAKCFLQVTKEFGQQSGLNLNVEKTEGMWLGSNRIKTTKPLDIQWPDRPLRVLGIFISYDQEACNKKNYIERIEKAKHITNMWMGRNLTMYGRSQIIKTFVMSQFVYAASIIHVPPDVIKMVNKLIFKFMWRNKKERLKRTVLINSISKGGMQVPDFQTMVEAAKLKWISKIINSPFAPWRLILEDYLMKCNINLHILLHSNFSMKSTGLEKSVLPAFYKELLRIWSKVGNTSSIEKNNFIWYNRNICVNKKCVFYKEMLTAGAWYITDLYDNNGAVVPFEKWVSRGVGRCNLIKWMGIVQATKRLVRSSVPPNGEPVHLSILSKGPIMDMNNKQIYIELLANKIGILAYVPKISKYLNEIDNMDWCEIYLRASKTPVDTKTKDFQYRFIQDLLSNKYWLCKWNLADSAICMYCNLHEETITHMFWDCNGVKQFWSDFENFWKMKGLQLTLSKENVFLGISDNFMCNMIFTAKRYIYNKKIHGEQVAILGFKGYIDKQKWVEHYLAKENNRIDAWVEKWSILENVQ